MFSSFVPPPDINLHYYNSFLCFLSTKCLFFELLSFFHKIHRYVEYCNNMCVKKSVENVENSYFYLYINNLAVEKIVDFLCKIFFIKKWFLFSTVSIILIVIFLILSDTSRELVLFSIIYMDIM